MKKFNRFQFDILLFLILILLQVLFNRFYYVRLEPYSGSLNLSDPGFFPLIEFPGGSIIYIPIMIAIYVALIAVFAFRKPRRPSLYYGLALVLLAQGNFWWGLTMNEGTNLFVENVFLPQITNAADQMLAQDITIIVLMVMMFIKLGVYMNEIIQDVRLTYQQQQTQQQKEQ